MYTPFSEIHQIALAKISDYDILKISDGDREVSLDSYLLSAQIDFQKVCKIDLLDKNVTLRQYNNELTDEIKEILATGEVYYWISPKVVNTELLKNSLSTKDFSTYSPANLLKEMQSLRTSLKSEFKQKIVDYSYRNGDISSLKV